jgi:hypothetical protein
MSEVSALVARLIASGITPELAAVVVTEAFLAGATSVTSGGIPVDRVTEKRRAGDRARKAEKRNSARLSTGNPPNNETALSSSSLTESESPKEVKKERANSNRGHTLPPDFKPSADHYNFATTEGIGYDLVDRKCAELHLWARANAHSPKARKADWNSAFMSWLRTLATERQANDRRTYNRSITGSEPIIAAASSKLVDDDRYRVFGGLPSVSSARGY